ncbi:MAG: DUF5107 domain-containing protein [Lachnospiraceae bacterium]
MHITSGFLTIQGAPLQGTNPLPLFRNREKNQFPKSNGTLLPEDLEYFGYESGFRILPYTMQDRYSRNKETLQIPSIVLENEHLRAEFLPSLGGRLYSLRNQKTNEELLFKNPVLQPANLAIRNAWFSGGIEWNIAQLGHTFSTYDDVFFAKVRTPDGYEFLRMYDYERTRGLLWQIDFHLPDGAKQLAAHVVIINDHNHSVPMYWWTNIAAKEQPGCRIFSGTKDVIYIEPQSMTMGSEHTFGRGELPLLPVLPDVDASYPLNSTYTNEFFFQNSKQECAPWEAITYTDGSVFFERSTQPLRIRKMFCWGKHQGGRNWCDFLSVPKKSQYVEIQAGFAPTQLHDICMEANSVISFTQIFGALSIEPQDGTNESYEFSQAIVRAAVQSTLSTEDVLEQDKTYHALSTLPCTSILHSGHGWGALEQVRRIEQNEPLFPIQLSFPAESITEEQYYWLALLQGQELPELSGTQCPNSWMIDTAYRPYLERYLDAHPTSSTAALLLGTILYENDEYEKAITLWKQGYTWNPLPLFCRNLAYSAKQEDDIPQAIMYMEQIPWNEHPTIDHAFLEEYYELLLLDKQWRKVYDHFHALPSALQQAERLMILTCEAAIELDEFVFLEDAFSKEYALIREGETKMTDFWFRYAKKRGIDESQLPKALDLRVM